MCSLSASSSVLPSPPALAHSYNSSGRLGMFVNPYACSCGTCVSHVAAEREEDEPAPAVVVSLAPPPPLARSSALGWGAGTGAGATPSFWSALAHASTDEEPAPTPALLRSATGAPEPLTDTFQEETFDRLRTLRAQLQGRQDAVYEEEVRSHDEMAAQDLEWEQLDRQIHAIEQLLLSFGAIFRQR